MSDLLDVDRKVREGDQWRDTIDLDVDDDTYEVKHRLLYDDEFSHVIDIIGKDKFQNLLGDADEYADDETREKVQRVQELSSKDELTAEEETELEELQSDEDVAGMDEEFFKLVDPDIVEAFQYAARSGVKADREDGDEVVDMSLERQEELFGDTAKTLEDAMKMAENRIAERLTEKSTGFMATILGSQVFFASIEEMGN